MMRIDTPYQTLQIARVTRYPGGNDAAFRMKIRREHQRFYFELRDLEPTQEQVDDAAEFLTTISGVLIRPDWLNAIFRLYPMTRIRLAAYKSVSDCEVRESLAFCLAHFLLGCRWPRFDEKTLLPAFLALLQEEAQVLGLSLRPHLEINPFVIGFPGQEAEPEEDDATLTSFNSRNGR